MRAVRETFRRRGTELPKETPGALSEEFIDQPGRHAQWKAFVRKGRLAPDASPLDVVIPKVKEFLMPVLTALADNEGSDAIWNPGDPWRPRQQSDS